VPKELHSLFNPYETMLEQPNNWFNDQEVSVKKRRLGLQDKRQGSSIKSSQLNDKYILMAFSGR
jgi:hypothetical protein